MCACYKGVSFITTENVIVNVCMHLYNLTFCNNNFESKLLLIVPIVETNWFIISACCQNNDWFELTAGNLYL